MAGGASTTVRAATGSISSFRGSNRCSARGTPVSSGRGDARVSVERTIGSAARVHITVYDRRCDFLRRPGAEPRIVERSCARFTTATFENRLIGSSRGVEVFSAGWTPTASR